MADPPDPAIIMTQAVTYLSDKLIEGNDVSMLPFADFLLRRQLMLFVHPADAGKGREQKQICYYGAVVTNQL